MQKASQGGSPGVLFPKGDKLRLQLFWVWPIPFLLSSPALHPALHLLTSPTEPSQLNFVPFLCTVFLFLFLFCC
ncbi:hypothetical protein VIGAN_05036400 [Vigna angularis var. angularis]|uniref:Uncharacterized protein n=1 Tax=Vigna angularis var. angularis TaxID=157739 RepID=A0A0S3S2H4_PHAAN|nr:hypothetical protein VIGAN_05036400 [Vigna angularis var. angularis]